MLGLNFCVRAFSSCGERGPLFIAVRRPLTVAASPVAEHRLQTRRLSSCGSRAQLLRGMWDLPRPGLEPVSPALAGRFSTTAPPGKPFFWNLNPDRQARAFASGNCVKSGALYWDGTDFKRNRFWRESQGFGFGRINFEMPLKNPGGDSVGCWIHGFGTQRRSFKGNNIYWSFPEYCWFSCELGYSGWWTQNERPVDMWKMVMVMILV